MVDTYGFLALFFTLATSGFARNLDSIAEVTDENLRRLATANNDLALNLHRQLAAGSSENIFFSPLSLSTAFGMLYHGTRGDTAKELRNALGYDRAGLTEVHQTFRKYLTETLQSRDTAAYTLDSANAVLLDKKLDLVPGYKSDVQDYYRASVKGVDFATQGPQVVREVNEWVREKTNNKINKLLEDLDSSTLMVLLNAVYFKGTWKTQFDPKNTVPRDFYNNGLKSSRTKIPIMRLIYQELPYTVTDSVRVLEMPYKGDDVSMVLLLPRQLDGLESLERSLTPTKFSELRRQLRKEHVDVTIPKFKLEYSKELSKEFEALGAKKVFTHAADFSGITKSNENIAVNQVMHKAVIEVNEEGSEAATVPGMFVDFAIGAKFIVNRPFLFAIIDKRNDMILFMGRVTNL